MHRGRTLTGLTSLALASALLIGCSAERGSDAPGESTKTPSRRFLSVGTAPPGGAFFVVGGAISEVLDATPDTGWQVTAEATKGSQENIRRLVAGELDLALSNSAISFFAVRGEGGWERAYPVRAVMTLAPNIALFLAPGRSGIRTLADLKGKRVVVGPAGAGFEYFLNPLLQAHGVTYDDFTPLHNTQTGAVDMLADGSAAAAFLGGAVPTASITQATASHEVTFISYSSEAITRLTDSYVFFRPATIPAGTYRGQDQDFHGLDVGSMHLIAAASADDQLVYELTRSLYDNREKVVERHPAGRAINPKNAARSTGIPFHPGAERFYREIGIWPETVSTVE